MITAIGETILILLLLGGLVYFLLDSTALLEWMARWVVAIIIMILFGFFIAIGIHYANIMFGW